MIDQVYNQSGNSEESLALDDVMSQSATGNQMTENNGIGGEPALKARFDHVTYERRHLPLHSPPQMP
jgi:hypothetical protein